MTHYDRNLQDLDREPGKLAARRPVLEERFRKPWVKVSKRGILTEIRAAQPGQGVWYRGERGAESSQSFEFGAKDGQIVFGKECWHGQHRSAAFQAVVELHHV